MQKPFLKAAVREFFHFNLADPLRFLLTAPLSIALLFQAALPAHGEGLQWSVLNAQVVSLYRQDRYQEAIPLAEEALALSVSSFGDGHSNVAIASNNLAALYHSLGQYDQAELFYNQALSIDQEVYGANHPHVAADRKNLKTLYRDHGRPLAVVGSGAASASRSHDWVPLRRRMTGRSTQKLVDPISQGSFLAGIKNPRHHRNSNSSLRTNFSLASPLH